MSRVIAIVKTAKDHPLWTGLPDDYPVMCTEFDSFEEAEREPPGVLIMRVSDYHEYARKFHDAFPAPRKDVESPGLWTKIKNFFGGL